MAAPKANAKTQLVNATGIRIEASGAPDKYALKYSPGESGEGRVKFTGDALPRLPMTGVVNYADGAYLVSALKGKLAEVEGLVQAKIKLAFAAGQPLQSSGTAKIIDMNFGTLPGPLSGVNTELTFTNIENGVIEFEMIPDGVKVYSARWPLGGGFFSLDPFDWLYSNEVNRVVMRIEKVSIGEFLKDVGDGALKATGDLEGTLPIVMSGIDVKVDNGELFVREGGRIQYQSQQLNSISELDGSVLK